MRRRISGLCVGARSCRGSFVFWCVASCDEMLYLKAAPKMSVCSEIVCILEKVDEEFLQGLLYMSERDAGLRTTKSATKHGTSHI